MVDLSKVVPFRKAGGARGQYAKSKPFIAWDGEGQDLRGSEMPQSYVLYGCSTGDKLVNVSKMGLTTIPLLRFMLDVQARYTNAIHVGFAFDYDVNMILKTLSEEQLRELWNKQYVKIIDYATKEVYCIRVCRGKWISVSRHKDEWNRKHNPNAKQTIRIYDIFSFFGTSFVKVCEMLLGESPELERVRQGKKHRGGSGHCPECKDKKCPFDNIEYVADYWETEIELLRQVAEKLREQLYSAGYKITQWYGPGAIASYTMRTHGVQKYMGEVPVEVQHTSCFAYAGGRFEQFKIGRLNEPVWGYDINSAYPDAVRKLRCMTHGKWRHVVKPTKLEKFALYHVRLHTGNHTLLAKDPSPLFHRSKDHNITFPWNAEGWYWSPEVFQVKKMEGVEIVEGWEFIPECDHRPFAFIEDMYAERLRLKNAGDPRQMAHKLATNSIYGKLAQRIGWTEENQRIPPWHRLEWAGWITSYVRAVMWKALMRAGYENIVATETDGFYTTVPPERMGLPLSDKLGEWGMDKYDEVIYLQSGLAWLKHSEKGWQVKRRGMNEETFRLDDVIEYVKSLKAIRPGMSYWESYKGEQTRFMTLGASLNQTAVPFKEMHCSWRTTPKEIKIGVTGKRIHVPYRCTACQKGASAYDMLHDMVVNDPKTSLSNPHFVPWLAQDMGTEMPEWMTEDDIRREVIM